MKNVFARPGESLQIVGGDTCPEGFIEMQGQRPDNNSIALADGQWGASPLLVPESCSRRQGLLALLSFGIKRSDVESQISVISDDAEREAAWIEYEATTWERSNPFLQGMWVQLGGSVEQLDDLFLLAVTL